MHTSAGVTDSKMLLHAHTGLNIEMQQYVRI